MTTTSERAAVFLGGLAVAALGLLRRAWSEGWTHAWQTQTVPAVLWDLAWGMALIALVLRVTGRFKHAGKG